jgi:hypothetical protein
MQLIARLTSRSELTKRQNSLTFKKAAALKFASLLLFSFLLNACASQPIIPHKSVIAESSQQRIYYYPYDNVWRAVQLALKYPIAINNMDNGVIETDKIRAMDGFQSPIAEKVPSSGVQYTITVTLSKGRYDGREAVRVDIKKKIERRRDFFADPEELDSDGLEEQVIFYRIERELVIEQALKRAAEKSNKS